MSLYGMAVYSNAEQNAKEVMPTLVAGPGLKATPSDKGVSVAWVNKLAIAKNTKNPDGAWKLVQFLTGKEQGGEFTHLNGNLPTRRDLIDRTWIAGMSKQVLATAESAISQPPHPVMMQLGPTVKALLEPAIRGTVGVEDTLKQIDEKVGQISA
jgi:multiple sugar transport system substrate-binding protein